mmetsp:Transcript_129706/g.375663  ORF Transcript_129706/g.375663 Transcript_129706/m.375663 type:complete len:213 (+) Transcript_129706:1010-1648(+)
MMSYQHCIGREEVPWAAPQSRLVTAEENENDRIEMTAPKAVFSFCTALLILSECTLCRMLKDPSLKNLASFLPSHPSYQVRHRALETLDPLRSWVEEAYHPQHRRSLGVKEGGCPSAVADAAFHVEGGGENEAVHFAVKTFDHRPRKAEDQAAVAYHCSFRSHRCCRKDVHNLTEGRIHLGKRGSASSWVLPILLHCTLLPGSVPPLSIMHT